MTEQKQAYWLDRPQAPILTQAAQIGKGWGCLLLIRNKGFALQIGSQQHSIGASVRAERQIFQWTKSGI